MIFLITPAPVLNIRIIQVHEGNMKLYNLHTLFWTPCLITSNYTGTFGAALNGATMPIFAVLFAEVIGVR